MRIRVSKHSKTLYFFRGAADLLQLISAEWIFHYTDTVSQCLFASPVGAPTWNMRGCACARPFTRKIPDSSLLGAIGKRSASSPDAMDGSRHVMVKQDAARLRQVNGFKKKKRKKKKKSHLSPNGVSSDFSTIPLCKVIWGTPDCWHQVKWKLQLFVLHS